jgi:pilus assembly protein CpaE
MSRMSVFTLSLEGEDDPAIHAAREAAASVEMGFDFGTGSFEELKEIVRSWTVLPEIVMIDIPEGMDAVTAVAEIGAEFPEGEAEVLVFNVPNDIPVYRALKAKGVREIFPGDPTAEEVTEALNDLAKSHMTRSGIDPRKAIYVWSSCGGAGGSSLAFTIAKRVAKEGRRTLFIDLDLSTGTGSFMFNADKGGRETQGLIDALANPARIDALFLERAIDVAGKNLFYLSARRKASDPTPTSAALPVLIARAQQNFDMIVIDVPWRAAPEPDMTLVQGHSYIVTPPTPAGLLGFTTLAKELHAAPGKSPIHGVLNRSGEYKTSEFDRATFKNAGGVDIHVIPYDAASAGRMLFEQKTYLELGGKIPKAVERILKTLPNTADDDVPKRAKSGKKSGFFGR